MVILGGLGSVWGVMVGALLLANINYYLIPDVLNGLPGDFGLNFNLTELQVSIFGFLLVLVMVLRPQGLIPERRRKLELTRGIGETELGRARNKLERRRARRGRAMTVESPAPTRALGSPIMSAEEVSKEFGGLVAVNQVSVDVPVGSIVSIIGPNGAGKTTFFNMLTGLYKSTSGRIVVLGSGHHPRSTRRHPT